MGLTIETEMWQPGNLMTNKINTDHTYPDATNNWALLEDNNKEKQDEEINIIKQVNTEQSPKMNKWKQRI
jgi:hypothetical protein